MGTRLVAVVQARLSSTRLPGKVLLPLGDETVLARVVRGAQDSGGVDEVVVATSTQDDDDAVAAECARIGVPCARGPLDDVLARFVVALDAHPADAVVRITGDNPLLDPAVLRTATDVWRAVPGLDYLSTALVRTLPLGLDVEIASVPALRQVDAVAEGHDRIHVTSHLYSNPERYQLLGLTFSPAAEHLRLTLDSPADLEVMTAVVGHFGRHLPSRDELVAWLSAHPEVAALNADVRHRTLAEG